MYAAKRVRCRLKLAERSGEEIRAKKKEELGEKTAHEAQIIRDSIAGTRTRGRMRVSLRERPAADDLASQATV